MRKYRVILADENDNFIAERFVDAQNMSEAKYAASDLAHDEFGIDDETRISVSFVVSEKRRRAYEAQQA